MSASIYPLFSVLTFTTVTAVVVGSAMSTERRGAPDRRAPAAEVIVFNDNGAWSWFEDERAVVDPSTGTLLVSSVADAAGTGGAARDGNVEVVAYDLAARTAGRTVLHAGLEADDHDSAALYVRPDGRYVAMYSRHNTDRLSRWRVTRDPGDATVWEPERTFEHGASATYSNLYPATVGGEARLYGFVRSVGRDPYLLVSLDHGTTWADGGRLLVGPGRPYVRYATDGAGRIHLISTEQHPDDFANGIYHGVIADGRLLQSDGTMVDTNLGDDRAAQPNRLTEVFAGDTTRRAWTVDLDVDASGWAYAAFSVHTGESDHQYYYARFDGTAWRVHFMAHAGTALYPAEQHYTGLVALDPHRPERVFISTDVDPATGLPLISNQDLRQHHELFEGITVDGGAHWAWTAVTANSTADNIRPIVPVWDANHTALLWLRGTYTRYDDYDLDVVGIITEHGAELPNTRNGGQSPAQDHRTLAGATTKTTRPVARTCSVVLTRCPGRPVAAGATMRS